MAAPRTEDVEWSSPMRPGGPPKPPVSWPRSSRAGCAEPESDTERWVRNHGGMVRRARRDLSVPHSRPSVVSEESGVERLHQLDAVAERVVHVDALVAGERFVIDHSHSGGAKP